MQRTTDPAEVLDNIPGLVVVLTADGTLEFVNQRVREYFGLTLEELKGWITSDAIHPDDLSDTISTLRHAIKSSRPYRIDDRLRRFDGVYRWFHHDGIPIRDAEGRIVNWYVLFTDIHERKIAEDELRRSEAALHEAQKMTHTGSWRLDVSSLAVTATPEMGRIFGVNSDDASSSKPLNRSIRLELESGGSFFSQFHPEDRKRFEKVFGQSLTQKTDLQTDYRIVLTDGTIRHHRCVGHPVLNDSGQMVEFIGTTVDDTDHWRAKAELERALEEIKRLRDRLQDENLALREEIIRSSMFEEIVGSSQPLRLVLEQVAKVATSDSTVLIAGETGTGKELVARAIHKRSNRSARAFISVNCGAIPQSLIASELFGHEKGAFTGAVQRRIGCFEAAIGGTLFLDEVGELPLETQVALLRVLQEREFERVGGSERIRVDVRVLAATNRDLKAAVRAGSFRADLFYRLNVFPIEIPPLRDRVGDIPLLVEYLIDRYGKNAGKKFSSIGAKTLEALQKYNWPGNIRELQNVIERAVIVCDGPSFSIDEMWLKTEPTPPLAAALPLPAATSDGEKELIERALARSRGRVSGPSGAAAKLGIARQTLESRILRLGINKHQFKT